jgi:transcriptional regulator with XRE-family HTH domain
MSTKKKWYGFESLEKRLGPVTIAMYISSFRISDGISQTEYARRLKISRANLCDIEKGRKLVSPARAAQFAKVLGVSELVMVQIAIQDLLRQAKLKYKVEIKSA